MPQKKSMIFLRPRDLRISLMCRNVSKALRQISVEGCEMIGSGAYGKVYRIDPETIAKIYTPGMSLEEVQKERDTAQKAFLLGIPTAISYDVVKSDDCYGVVFELLNAKTVAQCMDADPSCVKKMGVGSAKLLRELHQISVEDKTFPERKQEMLDWVEKIVPVLDASEIEEIRSFIQSVPDSKNFLHGDFNSKNIMVNGDEFLLIDIGDAAIGHAVFDVAGLVLPYRRLINSKLPAEERKRLLGFRLEDANLLLHTLIAAYFGIDRGCHHGKKFKEMAAQLNSKYHLNVTKKVDISQYKRVKGPYLSYWLANTIGI